MALFSMLAAVGAFVSVLLLMAGIVQRRRPESVQQRLEQVLQQRRTAVEDDLRQPLMERLARPMLGQMGGVVGRFAPARLMEATHRQIQLADLGQSFDASAFMALRVLASAGLGLVIAILALVGRAPLTQIILGALAAGGMAFMLPSFWLGGKVKKRQDAVRAGLPDALDLLTLCIEAMPFDRAFARVTENAPPVLQAEFGRVIKEMHLGALRRDALRNLADRIGIEELNVLVGTIIQAEQRGTPLVRALQEQAADMRTRRRRNRADIIAV
ncbi:MAG: type II secretion system F family protein [Ktedonobacterales bacterium]|nr:type II secretion system F family protein [Ktedonobacterales bacterium]